MIEVGCEGPMAFIAGLAGPINELAAIVNRSPFAMRTCQAQPGDREIRYFMTQQIDEVGKRGLVDRGYFTVSETSRHSGQPRIQRGMVFLPGAGTETNTPRSQAAAHLRKAYGRKGYSWSHALGTSYAQETVARSWARRRVVY